MLLEKFLEQGCLEEEEFRELLDQFDQGSLTGKELDALTGKAVALRQSYYGKKVYTRGLIEFTNYCKNNCYYCGIQGKNSNVTRYRLTEEEILSCCESGYGLGFRTFVLQGGEDPYYTKERMTKIIKMIKSRFPDCAITLSVGEKDHDTYAEWREAGADRYLLRHETADEDHYRKLHPDGMTFEHRKDCLYDLKSLGYQVGAGFMVGSPYQTNQSLAKDLMFLKELQPDMVGIGPFISHHDTCFKDMPNGTAEKTIFLLSVIRVLLPYVLLPATTALGTVDPLGREKGIKAGANVVMPNLSPVSVRKQYELYDSKICTGEEAAECRGCLERRIASTGYEMVAMRGDVEKK